MFLQDALRATLFSNLLTSEQNNDFLLVIHRLPEPCQIGLKVGAELLLRLHLRAHLPDLRGDLRAPLARRRGEEARGQERDRGHRRHRGRRGGGEQLGGRLLRQGAHGRAVPLCTAVFDRVPFVLVGTATLDLAHRRP